MQHFDAGNYHTQVFIPSLYSCCKESCTVVQCVIEAAMELGYSSMKPEQVEVAVALIEGRDVFAILWDTVC